MVIVYIQNDGYAALSQRIFYCLITSVSCYCSYRETLFERECMFMKSFVPATGNYASPVLWIGIIVVAVIALVAVIVVCFRYAAGKFLQRRHDTHNRTASQVLPNRLSLLVSVTKPNRFIVSKCFQQSHSNIRMTNPVSCLFLLADFFEALHKFRNILLLLGLSLLLLSTLEQVLVVHETGQTKLVEDSRKVLGNG